MYSTTFGKKDRSQSVLVVVFMASPYHVYDSPFSSYLKELIQGLIVITKQLTTGVKAGISARIILRNTI
jgi:hypothetical protein